MTYKLIRSNRKTIAIEVHPDGILVRAPFLDSISQIENFLTSRADWIKKAQSKIAAAPTPPPVENPLSMEEIRELANRALQVIPERVRHYAALIGVSFGLITIRNQRSRWGSCSAKGNLNFNCLLMLVPEDVRDYVVVHELCHMKEMNHSARFYAEIAKVFPDYDTCDAWLKQHGRALLSRMPGNANP